MNDFIQALSAKWCKADPDNTTTTAKCLIQLSKGIYTKDERFIFELLQNAVDAFPPKNDCLRIKIVAKDNFLIFMHNGEAFSERDIKGLCDVGNGNKMKDVKKIGYKGIGFKSVFMDSTTSVTIESGGYCFQFNKDFWHGYWDKPGSWNEKEYGRKDLEKEYLMPWQIMPIAAIPPIQIDNNQFNVTTYIELKNVDSICEKIDYLMKSSQILLFLQTNNITMSFYQGNNLQCKIGKETHDNKVSLFVNDVEISRWLIHKNENIEIPNEKRDLIDGDERTPEKLREATSFELSLAVELDLKTKELKKAENPVMYSYLPTTFKFGDIGFPFLVNANFITDAGREHLLETSEWNKMIISKIPEEYLSWMATLSTQYPNYYEVLPQMSYGEDNELLCSYSNAIEKAVMKIAFIPNMDGDLLRADEAVIDVYDLKAVFSPQSIINHINKEYKKQYRGNCWINVSGKTILKDYGVFVLGKKCLAKLLADSESFDFNTSKQSLEFILFTQEYVKNNPTEKEALKESLSQAKFVYSSDNQLHSSSTTYFCSKVNISNSNLVYVCTDIMNYCLSNPATREWLEFLGVKELSLGTYLADVICSGYYVTEENVIEIGEIIYEAYRQGELSSLTKGRIWQLKFLTTKGTLKRATELYMSAIYSPRFDFQAICDDDIFVSEEYAKIGDPNVWRCIWAGFGIPDDIILYNQRCERNYIESIIPQKVKQNFLDAKHKLANSSQYVHHYGYDIHYYPHTIDNEDNEQLRMIFSKIFRSSYNDEDESRYLEYRWDITEHFEFRGGDFWRLSFQGFRLRDYLLKYVQKYPTTTGIPSYAEDVFINSPENVEIVGNYLPVLDIDVQIDDYKWIEVIPFKRELNLDDILTILSLISNKNNAEDDDKKRIERIYQYIIEKYGITASSVAEKLSEWGACNKILSDNGSFYSPSELIFIDMDGFKSYNRAYIGRIDEHTRKGVIALLQYMGVRIITKDIIRPKLEGMESDTKISSRLLSTLPALAVLACDCDEMKSYQEHKGNLQEKIENTLFYQCESIALAYDDSDDKISKATFAQDGKFYFTGELRPAKLEPLLHPLCSYLGLKGKERDLFVIMTEPDFLGIIEYLEDKEYDVTEIKSEMVPSVIGEGSDVTIGGEIGGGISTVTQIAENKEAKTLVLEKLKEHGFDVSEVNADWSVIDGVKKDGEYYPLVVKSCKNWEHQLLINPNEWEQLFKPNSMLWLHLSNRVVVPIKAYELFTYQDKLTLTFDTVNLMMDDRIGKIMEVMRFFNNVHLDVAALTPDQNRAEQLEEYLFNANNARNSDLSTASIDD